MTGIFFDGDTKVCLNFSSNFENLPYVVVFFSTANRILYANKFFQKKFACKI